MKRDTSAHTHEQHRSYHGHGASAGMSKAVVGVVSTLAGGTFWGLSGTCASFLFDVYHVDTLWLMSVRQIVAGAFFLIPILLFERDRFKALWTSRRDLPVFVVFALSGVLLNQFGYLLAVKLMNAGTATVLQCLQLIIVMVYACIRSHRAPRKREIAGVALALGGTYLIATGGDPSTLTIPLEGLVVGLIAAVGAACMTIIPTKLLATYGSATVTGSGMLLSGIISCSFIRPWENPPALDAAGLAAFFVLAFVGSFLAYMLYLQGVKDIGALKAGLIGTVEPVSATITSALLLGTVFSGTDIAGFAFIIIMVFLTV